MLCPCRTRPWPAPRCPRVTMRRQSYELRSSALLGSGLRWSLPYGAPPVRAGLVSSVRTELHRQSVISSDDEFNAAGDLDASVQRGPHSSLMESRWRVRGSTVPPALSATSQQARRAVLSATR